MKTATEFFFVGTFALFAVMCLMFFVLLCIGVLASAVGGLLTAAYYAWHGAAQLVGMLL